MSKHRGEPVFKYEITLMESDSWSGRNEWVESFDTRKDALERIAYVNSFNTSPVAPDYYMQAYPEVRKVQQ